MRSKSEINFIISKIDKFLDMHNIPYTYPVEVGRYLDKIGILKDSENRPGLPLRKLLRGGEITHAYKNGANWVIPHSQSEPIIKKNQIKKIAKEKALNKHKAIGSEIEKIIQEKYGRMPKIEYEYKPLWLKTYPALETIKENLIIREVYHALTDDMINLERVYKYITDNQLKSRQAYDIWIAEPFNFAVEFDEEQHFNQFRLKTFDFYNNLSFNGDFLNYKNYCTESRTKPGTSGFTKLKNYDPLFPEFYESHKQDNRIRQRAFRDFLKDYLPIINGKFMTLRIPFQIIGNKRNNFDSNDLLLINSYLKKYI